MSSDELGAIRERDRKYKARVGPSRYHGGYSNASQAARDRADLLHIIDLQEEALRIFREGKPTKPCHPEHMMKLPKTGRFKASVETTKPRCGMGQHHGTHIVACEGCGKDICNNCEEWRGLPRCSVCKERDERLKGEK